MKQSAAAEYWELLNRTEDYIRAGFRRPHPPFPGDRQPAPPDTLSSIAGQIAGCRNCRLHRSRRKTVPGAGSPRPVVLVVGEAPGGEEDRTGEPFVGNAGRYLDKWLGAVKIGSDGVSLSRKANIYITNLLKCRPPGNRDPEPDELDACWGFLERQIALLRPKAILTVSRFAAQRLTGQSLGIGELRGKVYRYKSIALVPTYHPSAVLRNPSLRAPVWEDLKHLRSVIDDG